MNNYVDVEELMAGGSTLKRSVKPEDIVTMKADMRFPNVQQTYACWAKYNEFLLCANKLGPDTGVCHRLLRDALCACPQDWVRCLKFSELMLYLDRYVA